MGCIFCDIVNKQIKALIVGENKNALAFLDVNPISDGHTIVIPKQHIKNLTKCPNDILHDVMDLVKEVANKIMNSKLNAWGINYLCNEGNVAGQEVMHLHIHIIPKYGKKEGLIFTMDPKHHYVEDVNLIFEKLKD